jgi:hypothetical protein
MNLAGGTPLIIRRLIVPLAVTAAAFIACAVQANAQGAFPAPLPNQAASPFPPVNGATPANNASPFPPVNGGGPAASIGQPSAFTSGTAPIAGGAPTQPMGAPPSGPGAGAGGPSDACMKGFMPLREDAEKRGKVIKAAMERKAPAEETCKLIEVYSQAELKMMNYVKLNQTKCNIPAQISEQMKKGHEGTEATLKKCNAAAQAQHGPAGPSLSEVLGSSAALPEATTTRKGGSTFDTLNGNVLAR